MPKQIKKETKIPPFKVNYYGRTTRKQWKQQIREPLVLISLPSAAATVVQRKPTTQKRTTATSCSAPKNWVPPIQVQLKGVNVTSEKIAKKQQKFLEYNRVRTATATVVPPNNNETTCNQPKNFSLPDITDHTTPTSLADNQTTAYQFESPKKMLLARYRENVAAERIVSLPDIVASSPPSTGRKFVNELNVADIDDNMVLVKMEQIIKVEGHMEELLIEEVMMVEDDMEGVMIEKSDMKQARMEEGNVEDVMMEEAYMTEVKMEQDDTKQSIMGQADMEQAELESANESNVTKVNIADRDKFINMEEAYMTEVKMEQDDTKQSIMGQADMEQAELESANESNVTKVDNTDRECSNIKSVVAENQIATYDFYATPLITFSPIEETNRIDQSQLNLAEIQSARSSDIRSASGMLVNTEQLDTPTLETNLPAAIMRLTYSPTNLITNNKREIIDRIEATTRTAPKTSFGIQSTISVINDDGVTTDECELIGAYYFDDSHPDEPVYVLVDRKDVESVFQSWRNDNTMSNESVPSSAPNKLQPTISSNCDSIGRSQIDRECCSQSSSPSLLSTNTFEDLCMEIEFD